MKTCNLCDGAAIYKIGELQHDDGKTWTHPILHHGYLCQSCADLAGKAPSLLTDLVVLVERCRQLEEIFPQQAGLIHAMTKEARETILSVQTEKSEAD